MLILARRAGESFFIGDDVEIRVVDITPSRVKIGVLAPRQLAVLRAEMKRTAEQNLVAAKPAGNDAVARLLAHLRGK